MGLLTQELVEEALELAKPSILAILNFGDTTWGPEWVAGYVDGPGLENRISFQFGKNYQEKWNQNWGSPQGFFQIAQKKLDVAKREKLSTSVVVDTRPWCLKEGEFFYPGGVYRDGISVATSGAIGRTDEAISEIILSCIRLLCFLEMGITVEGRMEV